MKSQEFFMGLLARKQAQKKVIHFPVILRTGFMSEGKSLPCEGQDSVYKYIIGMSNRKLNIFNPKDSMSQRAKGYGSYGKVFRI